MKDFAKRAIHLDFHTMPGIYDVGIDFNGEEFAQTLKNAHVDYITAFARCNLGFAYYPTKVGIVHPGMKVKDMLGPMISACHKQGIRVVAYINAGLDHEHALLHREWCKVNKEGIIYDVKVGGSFFRHMCLNTGYRQHLLDMIDEVLEMYPIDGLFLDCFSKNPCYGIECLDGMKKLGMDASDEQQAIKFNFMKTEEFREEVISRVRKKNPEAYMCFNGLPYTSHPDHVEIEVLPPDWGYEYFPWTGRYVRTLDKPFFKMTGRFHKSWGDFGGLRTEESLLFDCYNAVANGATCSIGDHMHPRGKLDEEVYKLIGRVYSKIEKLEPWTYGSQPVAEIAILHPATALFPAFFPPDARRTLPAATRMLMELKYLFDVIDGESSLSKYRVIIIPEEVFIGEKLKKKLKQHLEKGGFIISAGTGGLDEKQEKFALEEYNLLYLGPEEHNPSFFKAGRKVCEGLPDMLTTIYEKGVAVQAKKGAEVLCNLYQPYFNVGHWDMRHWHRYAPPEKDTGRPALTKSGNIFHFSFSLFRGYYNHAVVAYRQLLSNCLKMALPDPLITTKNAPSYVQVTLTTKDKKQSVHILSYIPEKRGERMEIIEAPICIKDITIGLRKDRKKITKVYLAPCGREIEFRDDGMYVWVDIPEVIGYQMVVFE